MRLAAKTLQLFSGAETDATSDDSHLYYGSRVIALAPDIDFTV